MTDGVAVVTDSIANLTPKMVEQYRIEIVPIMLLIQGKIYRDGNIRCQSLSTSPAYAEAAFVYLITRQFVNTH